MLSAVWFKVFGVLTLIFEALELLILLSSRAKQLGPLDSGALIRISVFFFSSTVIAVGLFFLRKCAALFFSLALCAVAVWLILGSIIQVPFPWNLINIFWGIILVLPVVVTIHGWSRLSWGGRWLV